MQPCSREMQAMNSLLNSTQQIHLQDLQVNGNGNSHQQMQNPDLDPTSSQDDFLEQMLSILPSCPWSDLKSPWDPPKSDETGASNPDDNVGFHYDKILASKFRQHQINGGGGGGGGGGSTMPLSLDGRSAAGSHHQVHSGEGSMQNLYNGFSPGSLHGTNQSQHFHHPQTPNLGVGAKAGTAMNQTQASGSTTGATPAQPKQRVRAKRGQATDPHSIAERLRRERIAERMKALQELVPNANKTDKASMLDEIIDYVKFLQLQVKVLSMSRLGGAGAGAVAPPVADKPSEGGGDCVQTTANGGGSLQRNSNGNQLTVTEHQVAKLMEEDMGSAMLYLQGKGLCLMPISLATAISTATCHSRNPMISNASPSKGGDGNHPLLQSNGEGPSSPNMSVLTVHSATRGNGGFDGSVKDATSISEP